MATVNSSHLMSTLALQGGGSTCRLSATSPLTGAPHSLAPSPAPPHHNIVISVDLLEELAMISPSPRPRVAAAGQHKQPQSLLESIGLPSKGGGFSRALQGRLHPSAAVRTKGKLRLLDDAGQPRGALRTGDSAVPEGEGGEGGGSGRKVFCVTGSKQAGSGLGGERVLPDPLIQPPMVKLDPSSVGPRRWLPHKDPRTPLFSSSTDPYSSTHTGNSSSPPQQTSGGRRERLCHRGPQVRDIPGFETVSCKLHEKQSTDIPHIFQFESAMHPINCRESDFMDLRHTGSLDIDRIIRVPTGMDDARQRGHLIHHGRSVSRASYYGSAGTTELRARRKKSPAPPRGYPASKKFMMKWLEAGCERTNFSESLRDEALVLKRKSYDNEAFFKWARAANRIRLLPKKIDRITSKDKLEEMSHKEVEKQNKEQ